MTAVNNLINDRTGLGSSGETMIGKKIGGEVVILNTLRHEPGSALRKHIVIGGELGGPIQEAAQGRHGSGRLTDYRGKSVIAAWRYIPTLVGSCS